jgi:uncharacterized alpha-E superfamily protein
MLARVAGSLYWMARYLERAEHTARLLEAQLELALDEAPHAASLGWICLLNGLKLDLPFEVSVSPRDVTAAVVFDPANPNALFNCVAAARENARQIREQLTAEMWEELNRLHLDLRGLDIERIWRIGPVEAIHEIRRGALAFAGAAEATLEHGEGWQFIRLGRFLERAVNLAWLLDAHFGLRGITRDEPGPEDVVAWAGLLRGCTAFETYCKRYAVALNPRQILSFLVLDAEFPHTLRFCAAEVERALNQIADWTGTPRGAAVVRRAGRLRAGIEFASIDEVADDLTEFLRSFVQQCFQLHGELYGHYIDYAVDSRRLGSMAPV